MAHHAPAPRWVSAVLLLMLLAACVAPAGAKHQRVAALDPGFHVPGLDHHANHHADAVSHEAAPHLNLVNIEHSEPVTARANAENGNVESAGETVESAGPAVATQNTAPAPASKGFALPNNRLGYTLDEQGAMLVFPPTIPTANADIAAQNAAVAHPWNAEAMHRPAEPLHRRAEPTLQPAHYIETATPDPELEAMVVIQHGSDGMIARWVDSIFGRLHSLKDFLAVLIFGRTARKHA